MLREETKKILNKHGIRLSKEQGQSHIVDEEILERIIEYGNISSSDFVLEIGPGIGNLTFFLVENAGKVLAVEKDKRLVNILRSRFSEVEDLEIVHGDALEVELPEFDKVISNLPYSISSPLTFRLFEKDFNLGVLMYQEEFARRMVASPGSSEYSRLSVSVKYYSEAEILEKISPDKFIPQPEVNSAIVRVRSREPSFQVEDEDLFFNTVRAAFQHRRQKIRNGIFHSFQEIFPDSSVSSDRKRSFIDNAIPEDLANRRPKNVSPEEFGIISDSLYRNKED